MEEKQVASEETEQGQESWEVAGICSCQVVWFYPILVGSPSVKRSGCY